MRKDYWQEYESGSVYHVYNRSNDRKDIFIHAEDYRRFLLRYRQYFHHIFKTYAYCLMPNHFHLVIKVRDEDSIKSAIDIPKVSTATERYLSDDVGLREYISDQYRRLFSSHSLYINKKYDSRGQLFLNRHKRVKIYSKANLLNMICYAHHNPIHHGFYGEYDRWDYSSYRAYFSESVTSIDKGEIVELVGGLDVFHGLHDDFQFSMIEYKD